MEAVLSLVQKETVEEIEAVLSLVEKETVEEMEACLSFVEMVTVAVEEMGAIMEKEEIGKL